jgi:hypothetical protein
MELGQELELEWELASEQKEDWEEMLEGMLKGARRMWQDGEADLDEEGTTNEFFECALGCALSPPVREE